MIDTNQRNRELEARLSEAVLSLQFAHDENDELRAAIAGIIDAAPDFEKVRHLVDLLNTKRKINLRA